MSWYMILLLICLVIGPFDALYMYIKSERRRDELRRRKQRQDEAQNKKPSASR